MRRTAWNGRDACGGATSPAAVAVARATTPRFARRVHGVARAGFAADPALYARVRPGYPPEAVAFALDGVDPGRATTLEIASGTGILTKLLVDAGCKWLVAAEPVAEMREQFAQDVPNVRCIDAPANALPFEDASFDAVLVGQAFHWFADEASLVEIGRVLRPGGRLALLWNLEDDGVPWVRDVRAAYEAHDTGPRGDVPQYRKGKWVDAFDAPLCRAAFPDGVDRSFFDHAMPTTRTEIWERALSKSYVATLSEAERGQLVGEIEAIVARHEAAGGLAFDEAGLAALPVRSEVAVAVRGD